MSETATKQPHSTVSGLAIGGVTLLVLALVGGSFGLIWTAIFYISQGQFPISSLGTWNLLIGGFFFAAGIPMLVIAVVLLATAKKKKQRTN